MIELWVSRESGHESVTLLNALLRVVLRRSSVDMMPPREMKSERQRWFHHNSDGADSITATAAFMGS